MNFKPKTEEEIGFQLLPAGVYPFVVSSAEARVSKAGNEMIALVLSVSDSKGGGANLRDYLLEKVEHKLRHFCVGTNLESVYLAGKLSAIACVGQEGYARIETEENEVNDGRIFTKNIVKDYLKKDEWPKTGAGVAALAVEEEEIDDVPF
jgi:hypothetical protein